LAVLPEVFAGIGCLGDPAFEGGWWLVTSGEPGGLGDFLACVGEVSEVFADSEGPLLVLIVDGRDEPGLDLGGEDVL
jgi:hypothetical protein